tara:strand:- start:40 stop:618 length:579 start_codon:yes stop_codon:yes gene_type:complete
MSNQTYGTEPVMAVIPEHNIEYPVPQAIIINDKEDNKLLINAYQYGRTIRICVTIDAFFVFLNLFTTFNAIYLFSLVMLYFGYYGAVYYKRSYMNFYICYLLTSVFVNFIYLLYIINNRQEIMKNNDITESRIISIGCFTSLNLLISTWICKICYSFKKLISELKSKNIIERLLTADNSFLHQSSWNRTYLS